MHSASASARLQIIIHAPLCGLLSVCPSVRPSVRVPVHADSFTTTDGSKQRNVPYIIYAGYELRDQLKSLVLAFRGNRACSDV